MKIEKVRNSTIYIVCTVVQTMDNGHQTSYIKTLLHKTMEEAPLCSRQNVTRLKVHIYGEHLKASFDCC